MQKNIIFRYINTPRKEDKLLYEEFFFLNQHDTKMHYPIFPLDNTQTEICCYVSSYSYEKNYPTINPVQFLSLASKL